MHEILVRMGTFYLEDDTTTSVEILQQVAFGSKEAEFRPSMADKDNQAGKEGPLLQMLKRCWSEDIDKRPDFTDLRYFESVRKF